jgi:hypothetical protein
VGGGDGGDMVKLGGGGRKGTIEDWERLLGVGDVLR